MQDFFPGDSYETPAGCRRFLTDRLFGWTRWSFYVRFFRVVLWSKARAQKGVFTQEALAEASHNILKAIEGCGGRISIKGLDNIRKTEGPVVFIGNHMSTLEAVILPCLIAPIKPVSFIVKAKLVTGTFFGPVMTALDPVTVTRTDPRKDLTDVLTQGPQKIATGRSLVIFPQAAARTRSVTFNPSKFNSLGVKLAARAGVSVIPVALKTDFWGDGKALHDFGVIRRKEPICFEFGEPVPVSGRGKQEHEQIVEFIIARLKSWGVPVNEAASGASDETESGK
ncbi:MAG: 1-acyl-sn-glycerol-3-phosphate acyltransferase [Spirochaetales bacterium]|jgi:1-acyl-sn-glycerol-3-phosphate acyltransferase|nr:1-acyl-sn-glycerol-3-phosphate acyltransferase [Spirochaetales bacterium]